MKTISPKKVIVLLLVIFTQHSIISAQGIYQLWSATTYGGPDDKGTFFSTKFDGTGHTIKKSFTDINPGQATNENGLIAWNNKLYALLSEGGLHDDGIIAEYDPATNNYIKKADLFSIGAKFSSGKLTLYNGKLYGSSTLGGTNNKGTIFVYDPQTETLTNKYSFTAATGSSVYGTLVVYNNKLYGVTASGGASDDGVIFEFDPATNQYSLKASFNYATTGRPSYVSLIAYNNKLWGATGFSGGANEGGYIFSFDPATSILSGKVELGSIGAKEHFGSLAILNNKLYGMSEEGGASNLGILFQYDPATNVLSKEKDMSAGTSNKGGSMIVYNGLLYGISADGGANDNGVLFTYEPVSNTYNNLSAFSISTGSPSRGLGVFNNKMYFFTTYGGPYSNGSLYEYTPATNQLFRKINLGTNELWNPTGNTLYYNNKIYGVAYSGGASDKGGIFMYDPATGVYTIDQISNDLNFSQGTFLTLYNNKFYGCARSDPKMGSIFAYDPQTKTIENLFEFGAPNGTLPNGKLLVNNNKLLGTTRSGGVNDNGTLFEFDPSNNTVITKVLFDYTRGKTPRSGLIMYNGRIFGTAESGGVHNDGTLFEYLPLANGLIKLADFDETITGSEPTSAVTGYNNKLYGVTSFGQQAYEGALYEYDLTTTVITKKFQFDNNSGRLAYGGLTLLNNKFYGMADLGGVYSDGGVLYEYDPLINLYTKKVDFTSENGRYPLFNELNVIPAQVAPGVANDCSISNGVNINAANANEWIPFTDEEGRAIAEINANGNILGSTIVSYFINSNPVRQKNGFYYLDRSISFRSANQPATPVSIRLYIKKAEFDNLKTALGGNLAVTELDVYHNEDVCNAEMILPATKMLSTVGDWSTDYVFSASTTDLKTFYFAKANSVLPIKILSFNGEKQNTYNKLSWKASCTSGADFTLEKSSNGQNFVPLTTMTATSLDCNQPFTFNDNDITNGKNYYRLKIIENGGVAEYSNIVVIVRDGDITTTLKVVPNPITDGILKMQIQNSKAGNAIFTIVDMTGKKVLVKSFKIDAGNQLFQMEIGAIATGKYFVQYQNGNEKIVTSFFKN